MHRYAVHQLVFSGDSFEHVECAWAHSHFRIMALKVITVWPQILRVAGLRDNIRSERLESCLLQHTIPGSVQDHIQYTAKT